MLNKYSIILWFTDICIRLHVRLVLLKASFISENIKQKKSIAAKNRKPDSEETRQKKSKNAKGNKASQDHKWMTNGKDIIYPHISKTDYYLSKGYHFGRK